MNTIKIYFDTDGSIRELRKDFQLYQGQFHDKLLNVYVPTSVLAPDFIVENEQGQTIADFVASTSVKVGMKYLARNGSIKKSKNYYLNYLKVMTQNGVEYAVYERKLPKEFTTYVGQGQTAPVLVVNVVNMDVESDPAEVLSVVTTQECFLDVMPSADLDNDETVEPSEWELMSAEMNAVKETLLEKQDKTDPLLQTDAKTVVGAINENKENIDTNTTNIASNSEQIAGLRNDIADLTARVESGENYIGQMEGENMPSSAQLSQFVEDTVARATTVGDVVIFVLDSDPKRNYKFTYYQSGWAGYELTTVSKANNNIYGLLKGTYGIDSANEVLLDINNGEVLHVWVQDGAEYRDLKEFLGANKTAIAEILDGTTPVALAESAEKDGEGNNIVNTYLTQTAGATKQYVQDYAVPKTFTNVYFISADGYVGNPPAISETPAFSATTTGAGETEIIKDGDSSDLEMDLTASFDLSISNSYRNTFWVVASEDCNVQFRLVTQYKKPTEEWTDLNIELSEEYPLVADNYERIDFSSQFLSLGSETVSLGLGDKIRQFLSVKVQVDTPITFGVFSNTVYPSTFNLIAQNYVPAGATSVYVDGSPVATWNADTKMNTENPTGTGSLSLNRKENTIIGEYSTAEGITCEASGRCSHAEGGSCHAIGTTAHAEGSGTQANGNASHAEGDGTEANGLYSHAEGNFSEANGECSHAEGGSEANGDYSHTEGVNTIASRKGQHVFGKYNIADVEGADTTAYGKYVEIVGNGSANNARSNARTLDWDGNEVIAGKMQATGGFTDGNNSTYTAQLPDTTGWTSNKTIATTDLLPVGSLVACVRTTAPTGWLWCNGSTFNQADYPELYSVLGTNVLPDMNHCFPEGTSTASEIYSGTNTQPTAAGLPNIKGSFRAYTYQTGVPEGAFSSSTYNANATQGGTAQNYNYATFSLNAHSSNNIYNDTTTTVQPKSYRFMYIIKAV